MTSVSGSKGSLLTPSGLLLGPVDQMTPNHSHNAIKQSQSALSKVCLQDGLLVHNFLQRRFLKLTNYHNVLVEAKGMPSYELQEWSKLLRAGWGHFCQSC